MTSKWTRLVLVLVLVVVAASARSASAAPDVKACVEAFEAGQALRKQGKLLSARERLSSCTATACPSVVRTQCGSLAATVDAETPSVALRVVRGDADVLDAVVTLDGAAVKLDGQSLRLDPGPHVVVVRAAGAPEGAAVQQTVMVAAGEKNRVVTVALPAPAAAAAPEKPPAPAPSPVAHPPATPVWPWITLGVGAAAVGTFAVVGTSAARERDRLERECAPACEASSIDAMERRALLADVALGVGVVALGASLYGFVWGGERAPKAAVAVGPGGASILASVRF